MQGGKHSMRARAKILVVDRSTVFRRLLREAILGDSELVFAGQAFCLRQAIEMIGCLVPDAVILDTELPAMDGVAPAYEFRQRWPRLPLMLYGNAGERSHALAKGYPGLGNSEFLARLGDDVDLGEVAAHIRSILLPRLKQMCRAAEEDVRRNAANSPADVVPADAKVEVVCIGCSTGGPNALGEILPRIPADFPAPILVVQHMPAAFIHFLAERLNLASQLHVREAVSGTRIEPGTVWIAPGDAHMQVICEGGERRIALTRGAPENSCRPSVDVLFRSVAETYGSNALAVVLSGMGQDGARGCQRLASRGAQILVQDEASSVVWGMPGSVAHAALAQAILPLDAIASELQRRTCSGSRAVGL